MTKMKKRKKWYRQKTTWASLGAIASGLVSTVAPEHRETAQAATVVLGGLAAIFLRQGVESNGADNK